MKFTFEVDGREVTLSYDELEAIVREKFTTKDAVEDCETPTEGKAFSINPMAIDRGLFSQNRKDKRQERTRQLILEAFTEVDANPEKYAKPFKTMIMKKTWDSSKTLKELMEMAGKVGDLADWVEQAMEWAQRIANGETWERICNKVDKIDWRRVVMWKDGYLRAVGGSPRLNYKYPASEVWNFVYDPNSNLYYMVPLVVLR